MKRRRAAVVPYPDIRQQLELRAGRPFGVPHGSSAFASEDEREATWRAHGALMLARMEPDRRAGCWALNQYGTPDGQEVS